MCGRFTLSSTFGLQDRFEYINDLEMIERYNVCPSDKVLIIRAEEGIKKADFFRWGLIPSWSKDIKIGVKMINARAETVDEKPSFKRPLKEQRCLIIGDGLYEWRREGNQKQPYYFALKNRLPFAFAGLWDKWVKEGEEIYSCTIITTEANRLMMPIHDRMPVILPAVHETTWLDPNIRDTEYLKSLLVPYPEEEMISYPVTSIVNSAKNDHLGCIDPLNSI